MNTFLKEIVEKEAEEDIDLIPHEHEKVLMRAYRILSSSSSFRVVCFAAL